MFEEGLEKKYIYIYIHSRLENKNFAFSEFNVAYDEKKLYMHIYTDSAKNISVLNVQNARLYFI